MTLIKLGGGNSNLKLKKEELTSTQLKTIQNVGWMVLTSADENGVPYATIVEPSRYDKERVVIPVVQMQKSLNNMKKNPNICLLCIVENKEYFGDSIQYKLTCSTKIVYRGKLFDEVKHFEETERLPEGWTVKGIVVATIESIKETIG